MNLNFRLFFILILVVFTGCSKDIGNRNQTLEATSVSSILSLQLENTQDSGYPTCNIVTSKTNLDRYAVKNLLQTRALVICVDNDKFDRYDLKDFLVLKATLVLKTGKISFDRYDLKDFATTGTVYLVAQTGTNFKFDRYDIKDFLNVNMNVLLKDNDNKFDRYDVKDFLAFSNFQVDIRSSQTKFDRYDIKDFGNISQQNSSKVNLFIDDSKFDSYDIKDFLALGINVITEELINPVVATLHKNK